MPPPRPMLLTGPTFKPGASTPVLAGDSVDAIHYRVLSGSAAGEGEIVLHVRLEREYTRTIRGGFFEQIPDITEETLSGVLSNDGDVVTGRSVLIRDVPGVEFEPSEQKRSFIMERVPPPTAEP